MKRKFKFISLVLSMVMCFTLMVLGVYAATSSTLTVDNSVSFEAFKQVDCTVTYDIAGIETPVSGASLADFEAGKSADVDVNKSGAIPACVFVKNADETVNQITITINFKNTGDTDLTVSWNAVDFNATNVTVGGALSVASTADTQLTIASAASGSVTLTYEVADAMSTETTEASFDDLVFTLAASQIVD